MKASKRLNIDKVEQGISDSGKAFLFFIPENLSANQYKFDNSFDVISSIRNGYPCEAVNHVLEKTCVTRTQLLQILHISIRQLNRYEHYQRLPAKQSGFLYEFSRLYVRGLDIFGGRDAFENWLQHPQMALGEQTPLNLLDTTEGYRMVKDLMSQIEHGFYS